MKKLVTIYDERMWFRGLIHIAYWLLVWFFLNLFFGYGELLNLYSLYYSFIILLITSGVTYWTIYYLIPGYLLKGKYGLFIIYLLFTIIVSLDLELITVMGFLIYVEKFHLLMLDYNTRDIYSLLAGTYFIVFLSVAIKLTEFWFREQSRKQAALKEKIESELKLLKSQIHPHFLFNTLNNIYALALQKSDQAPEAVLKLSQMLDYLLYHGDNEQVLLVEETELIEHYIELEKLRYGNRLQVSFEKAGDPDRVMIAPVILLPFVENAFKHGISQSRNKVWLKILLETSDRNINFQVENSKPGIRPRKSIQGGMGLENLKRRLELLYKSNYTLEITEEEEKYTVRLNLILSDR
jgi:sensor histidine kinase YesM